MSLLCVTIKKARLHGGVDEFNTYVTVKLQNVKSTTIAVKGNIPCWEQEFIFETNRMDEGMVLELWSKGVLWDKLIGVHYMPLTSIAFSQLPGDGKWLQIDHELETRNGATIGTCRPTGHALLVDARFELPFDAQAEDTQELQSKLHALNQLIEHDQVIASPHHHRAPFVHSGISEDSDYTSDVNFPIHHGANQQQANSSAHQWDSHLRPGRHGGGGTSRPSFHDTALQASYEDEEDAYHSRLHPSDSEHASQRNYGDYGVEEVTDDHHPGPACAYDQDHHPDDDDEYYHTNGYDRDGYYDIADTDEHMQPSPLHSGRAGYGDEYEDAEYGHPYDVDYQRHHGQPPGPYQEEEADFQVEHFRDGEEDTTLVDEDEEEYEYHHRPSTSGRGDGYSQIPYQNGSVQRGNLSGVGVQPHQQQSSIEYESDQRSRQGGYDIQGAYHGGWRDDEEEEEEPLSYNSRPPGSAAVQQPRGDQLPMDYDWRRGDEYVQEEEDFDSQYHDHQDPHANVQGYHEDEFQDGPLYDAQHPGAGIPQSLTGSTEPYADDPALAARRYDSRGPEDLLPTPEPDMDTIRRVFSPPHPDSRDDIHADWNANQQPSDSFQDRRGSSGYGQHYEGQTNEYHDVYEPNGHQQHPSQFEEPSIDRRYGQRPEEFGGPPHQGPADSSVSFNENVDHHYEQREDGTHDVRSSTIREDEENASNRRNYREIWHNAYRKVCKNLGLKVG